MINGKKIALVLSGGGSKGFAHIGVLNALENNGIIPDIIVGTSMGSVVGGLYASGMSTKEMTDESQKLKFSDFVDINLFGILKNGVLAGNTLIKYLDKISHNALIENCKIKFACVSCDLYTGKQYIFDSGKLSVALRCSSAVPGIFAPYKFDGKLLVDGGVVNNNATDIAYKMGADYVISVDCIGEGYLIKKPKGMLDYIIISYNILQHNFEQAKKFKADCKIKVNNDYKIDEHTRDCILPLIAQGEKEVQSKIKKIKKALDMK